MGCSSTLVSREREKERERKRERECVCVCVYVFQSEALRIKGRKYFLPIYQGLI